MKQALKLFTLFTFSMSLLAMKEPDPKISVSQQIDNLIRSSEEVVETDKELEGFLLKIVSKFEKDIHAYGTFELDATWALSINFTEKNQYLTIVRYNRNHSDMRTQVTVDLATGKYVLGRGESLPIASEKISLKEQGYKWLIGRINALNGLAKT